MSAAPPRLLDLGEQPYLPTWRGMQAFTQARTADTVDEIWLLQHPAVFTQGLAGKPEHVLDPGDTEVIPTDRGGQVTYHGPGQLIVYPLLDLSRVEMGPRRLVSTLEQAVIACLADFRIEAHAQRKAPGVYVGVRKIASIGLRIRRGCCYHGVAINVAMDLAPFSRINPCGYRDLEMTQISDLGGPDNPDEVGSRLIPHLFHAFGWPADKARPRIDRTRLARIRHSPD